MGVFPRKMLSDCRKNHGYGQKKKQQGTSFGMFGVRTAAKCCELKRCADRVRSRTKTSKANSKLELFAFHQKHNWIFFNSFFPLIRLFLNFVGSAKTRVTMRFWGQKRGLQHRIISSVCHLILVILWCRRTNARSRDYYVTTKSSWLDRLQNLLSNGASLARYARALRSHLPGRGRM